MKYSSSFRVSKYDREHPAYKEERAYREAAMILVKDMPLEELKRAFNMVKITDRPENTTEFRAEIYI